MSQLQMKVQETVKRREQLLSYSGGHLHSIILKGMSEIDWSDRIFSRKFSEIWEHRTEQRARKKKKAKKTTAFGSKAFWKYFFTEVLLCLTTAVRLWDQEHCLLSHSFQSLAILSWALSGYWSKSYIMWIIWLSYVCVHITSPLGRSGSFQWDHAELLLRAHCLVIFWSVIHKTYEDPLQCNQCSLKCQIF